MRRVLLIFFNLLTITSITLFVTPVNGEELIHDPSRIISINGDIFGVSSGVGGSGLVIFEYLVEANEMEMFGPIFGRNKPRWALDFQTWNPSGEFDAPSVSPNGKIIFYTVYDENNDGEIRDAIGLVENKGNIEEPDWVDRGIVLASFDENNETPRAMDPAYFNNGDQPYLIFGSHAGGIYITRLNPKTFKLDTRPNLKSTAYMKDRFIKIVQKLDVEGFSEIEAGFVTKNFGKYYLFVNWGQSCRGVKSTYEVRVGRSNNILGPYFDRNGVLLIQNGGTSFIKTKGEMIGPGHVGISKIDKIGQLVTFHYYDGSNQGLSNIKIYHLKWDSEGWSKLGKAIF